MINVKFYTIFLTTVFLCFRFSMLIFPAKGFHQYSLLYAPSQNFYLFNNKKLIYAVPKLLNPHIFSMVIYKYLLTNRKQLTIYSFKQQTKELTINECAIQTGGPMIKVSKLVVMITPTVNIVVANNNYLFALTLRLSLNSETNHFLKDSKLFSASLPLILCEVHEILQFTTSIAILIDLYSIQR
eukprot:TRINITY_DN9315_c1_g1_i2.p1 TRINITY_DN9315_c1_g1~~TRINITY_DN9315_c1_g1_i2.p1  ORF type:complete len:196 (-),score=2.97 TRINITY_DN9315_c1_g1_i2:26-577(-)